MIRVMLVCQINSLEGVYTVKALFDEAATARLPKDWMTLRSWLTEGWRFAPGFHAATTEANTTILFLEKGQIE
jgi:hypothetical protein